MYPAVNVPKCHDERVSSGADDPISGEVCLDCAFVEACNTTQEHEARSEQVGGASVSSRKRVEGCPVFLSTVGKELSNRASDSQEASDRAAIQIPRSHGVQRKADGIRVSRVSLVADGSFSGLSQECKNCGKIWTCKKKPPEIHDHELCRGCSSKQKPRHNSDKVGGVVKVARTLVDVSPYVSGTGYIRELELSAAESLPSECTGCCDARTNTEFHSACKQNVSIVADDPISGEERGGCKRPKNSAKDSRQSEVGEELFYQSGAGSSQPCPVETEARSRTATHRVEHVSIVADGPFSGNGRRGALAAPCYVWSHLLPFINI